MSSTPGLAGRTGAARASSAPGSWSTPPDYGCGVLTTLQAVPFHASAGVNWDSPGWSSAAPVAMHRDGLVHDTASNPAAPAPAGFGVTGLLPGRPEPGEPPGRGVDALVGGGQRHPDMAAARRAVELAGCHQDARAGQRFDRGPAVCAGPGGPQVQARLGVLDQPAGLLKGCPQPDAPGGVAGPLRAGIGVV